MQICLLYLAGGRHHQQRKHKNCQIWGDPINKKKKEDVRIVFQNINGFGYKIDDEAKTKGFYDLMKRTEADIYTVAETNADWRKVPKKFTIWDQCREWFENVAITPSNNQHDRQQNPYQPGGTAVISQGDLALQIIDTGYDPHRMGKWSWALFCGKNNVKIRLVSIYRATKPQEGGLRKAYCQQQQALLKLGITESPDSQFWNDLWSDVEKWTENGDQLVL